MTNDNLGEIVSKCCVCERVEIDEDHWEYLPDTYITRRYRYSHGYCPKCYLEEIRKLEGGL